MTLRRRELLGAATASALAVPTRGGSRPARADRFLWGAATAAHQIEGGNTNSDYWALEHIAATYFKEPSGDACDSFNRWCEDIELVRKGGMNAYRFSIEWARIEPEKDEFSRAAIDHYRRICEALRDAGIEPVVTLHHFTSPRWIAATGGWENLETADRFARFVEFAVRGLGSSVRWYCTMNEPNAQVTSLIIANGKKWEAQPEVLAQAARVVGSDRFGAYFLGDAFKVRDVCLAAHAKARVAIKAAVSHAKVGMTLALQQLSAGPGGETMYRRVYDNARLPFYEAARGDEFIGIQTYNRGQTGPEGYLPKSGSTMVDMWDRDASPEALTAVADEAHSATGVPILVSENGINTADDTQRVRHLRASLSGLSAKIDAGLPVLGYIHWSLLDNFEWSSGYVPRFGLVAVDRKTFVRTPKPSLAAYRSTIAELRRKHAWA